MYASSCTLGNHNISSRHRWVTVYYATGNFANHTLEKSFLNRPFAKSITKLIGTNILSFRDPFTVLYTSGRKHRGYWKRPRRIKRISLNNQFIFRSIYLYSRHKNLKNQWLSWVMWLKSQPRVSSGTYQRTSPTMSGIVCGIDRSILCWLCKI